MGLSGRRNWKRRKQIWNEKAQMPPIRVSLSFFFLFFKGYSICSPTTVKSRTIVAFSSHGGGGGGWTWVFVWLIIKPSPWRPSLLPFPARQVAKTTPRRMPGVISMHSPSDCGSPSQEFSPGDPLECLTLDLASTKNVSRSLFQASVLWRFKPFAGIFSRCKAYDWMGLWTAAL